MSDDVTRTTPPAPTRARWSIAFNLVALVVLQLVFVAGLMGFTTVGDFHHAHAVATQQSLDESARAAAAVGKAITTAKLILAGQATLSGYDNVFNDPPSCTVTSNGADVFTKGVFSIVRGNGSVACTSMRSSGGLPGVGYGGSAWLPQIAHRGQPFLAGPLTDPVTGRRALLVVAPLSELPGALVLSLDLAGLGVGLERELGPATASSVLVTTADRSAEVTRSPGRVSRSSIAGTAFVGPVPPGSQTLGVDGVSRIFAESDVTGVGWHVIVGIPTTVAYAQAHSQLRDKLLFGALIVAMALIALLVVHRRIARPVRALAGAMERAAESEGGGTVPETGPRELAKLGRRVNRMLRERAENQIGLVNMFPDRRVGGRRELDRMKSAFLLAISHELRTPLTAVSGYASLLEEDAESLSRVEIAEYAHDIGVAASRLERLLLDILDMERLARGMLEAHRQPTDVADLVRRVLDFNDVADKVGVDIPAGTVENIDPGFVERIVENLVRNAVKHTPRGTPIWVRADERGDAFLLIVDDAGPGVPDEVKEEIFEPFRQGDLPDGTGPVHAPGTGVGLALVTQFARLHGGRTWVEDRAGGGSSFRVLLPGAHASKAARARRRAKVG